MLYVTLTLLKCQNLSRWWHNSTEISP